ncbi:uncharacterized protein LOC122509359 isoform X2 [Leptopilina heterotoma]|uniref:uncharacterized protein LOC122509359 isoform X2 n=1 Tax=Leptopilina heterotoma TaxID=63436 RepID=UPI001CA8F57C|nr:uncharacterized protein LOC122509359 isoform X2 [Leptopilina heterotoma]
MEEPQKLFRLPGTIEEEEEREVEIENHSQYPPRAESPLLGQRITNTVTGLPNFPKNVTLVRVSTQSSSIGGVGRTDSTSRYRPGPVRKLRRRAVLKSGECNVLQSRISRRSLRFLQDIFTTLVDTQWRWTLLCFTLSFLLSWLGFALIWWLIAFTHGDFDPRHLPDFQSQNNWTPCVTNIFSFTSCFLFSIETQHTIGYGGRSTTEECPEAIFVMCIQSISGVMIQAFMVGIVFAKMSRPKQRTQTLLFSRNAVICQRDGLLCLMFRVGDMRKSHIIGATIRAQVIKSRTTKEGEILPQHQQELNVGTDGENENIFFIWPMTIVHKIDAESPFYHLSAEDMLSERFEVVVILEGTIESTGQTTQARSSYLPQEILWGHRFESLVNYSKERQGYEVDYSLFNNTTQVDTPLCSGRELSEFYRVQDELRHGTGYLVDEDIMDPYHDVNSHCNHVMHRQSAIPGHHLMHSDSIRSETSLEDSGLGRSFCRDSCANTSHTSHHGPKESNHFKIVEIDPDAIHVIGDTELQQLPESVNREILRNSREIVYEDDHDHHREHNHKEINHREHNQSDLRDTSQEVLLIPKPVYATKKNHKYLLFDEERRSLNGSKRNLSNRNLLLSEDDKRSLNGSRRNLNGSKKYLLLALDKSESNRNLYVGSRENLIVSRRHTGSKEMLNGIKKNIVGIKGSEETPEPRQKRRTNDMINDGNYEVEKLLRKGARSGLQEIVVHRSERNSPFQETLIPNSRLESKSREEVSSRDSDFLNEGLFPLENNKSDKLSGSSVVIRNRRSYEHAQLQDVNNKIDRPNSGNSSSDSDITTGTASSTGLSGIQNPPTRKPVPFTSV